jgi:hypothetical protein
MKRRTYTRQINMFSDFCDITCASASLKPYFINKISAKKKRKNKEKTKKKPKKKPKKKTKENQKTNKKKHPNCRRDKRHTHTHKRKKKNRDINHTLCLYRNLE